MGRTDRDDRQNITGDRSMEGRMFWSRLACSFCGRSADDVAKLVAGPKVYICEACATRAVRIMEASSGHELRASHVRVGLLRTLRGRLRRLWFGVVRCSDPQVRSCSEIARLT
jgi:hypothetical protein